MSVPDPAAPLTLLTGFLGAGKTTLVNQVLNGGYGASIGVLVNDFGAVNIDRDLITGESEGVMSLENGCICCTLRDDLVGTVLRLLERPDAPRRVLLEASGIADPAAIAGTFLAPAFRRRLRLDGVICVVDAEQAFSIPEQVPLQKRQLGYADLVVINKTDLASATRLAALRAQIRGEFTGARLFDTVQCAVPPELLFSSGASREYAAPGATAEDHSKRVATWSFESHAAFCRDALYELARLLPPDIYRVKGIVRLQGRRGRPDQRGILQIVGRRADLLAHRPWQAGDEPSRLVFIGAVSAVDPGKLDQMTRACQAQSIPGD